MTTTSVGPRVIVAEKIAKSLERVRDQGLRYGSVTFKVKYREGVPLEEIEVVISELC